jgi:geranylgeranyl diphosphate synthase, type II
MIRPALHQLLELHTEQWCRSLPQDGLHEPIVYLMRLPAKRVRPALVLMGCELFGGRAEDAVDEALGLELFHNFTLMHDDIMDAAPLRRGQPTVHTKWGVNTAILSGDAMLVKAYQLMGRRPIALETFSHHALLVCQGQQQDMTFEQQKFVSVQAYMEMIRLKTAVLLSGALQIGAAVANASPEQRERAGAFAEHLGLAFQLQDDLLDTFGKEALTGKRTGGDLRAGKKTYLLIRGLERETQEGSNTLASQLLYPAHERDVVVMAQALERLGVRAEAEARLQEEHTKGLLALAQVDVPDARKGDLLALAEVLLQRNN